ncbi:OmpA family protein [Sphingomonas sp. SUN039]|uniref:OmpA family protein n=1 Tax=Sphingomonas sp. SUN039 TaxID=2937787 RepID=UPI002164293C|nr:OmpA family protein [Sphingomonas sp. SUN039]UVO54631.1 OmpA family protein [Sphingomonas sp. SUN039]
MHFLSRKPALILLIGTFVLPISAVLSAQEQAPPRDNITVTGMPPAPTAVPDMIAAPAGPDIKGIISARSGNRIQVTAADGTGTIIAVTDATKIRGRSGLFGGSTAKLTANDLLNGLPVTVKTLQSAAGPEAGLIARQIDFRGSDLKTAAMIRSGTNQRFDEQTAATAALRGRMGDIDNYNVKSTTNVNFDTGKAALSEQAKANLCAAAGEAGRTSNALLLVVGYTDSTGSQEFNQTLSEKRAASVMNYLQQACRWKPYRMLTPTGMAESDPLADNQTPEGKAQNRRVSVNVLVSKAVDGM